MFYLLAYGFTTIAAFAVLTLVRDGDGEATHLSQWAGLASRSPLAAAVMSFFLLAFAGIPLTSGFTGEVRGLPGGDRGRAPGRWSWSRCWPARWRRSSTCGSSCSCTSREPAADGPTVGVPGLPTTIVLAITAAATLVLGIVPGSVLDLADRAR